jgi:hypothetical protein
VFLVSLVFVVPRVLTCLVRDGIVKPRFLTKLHPDCERWTAILIRHRPVEQYEVGVAPVKAVQNLSWLISSRAGRASRDARALGHRAVVSSSPCC